MGVDKARMILGNQTFLDRLVATIVELGFLPNIVSKSVENYLSNLRVILDYTPQIGPLGGLYQALTDAKTDYVCYLSCDIPLLPKQVLSALIQQTKGSLCIVSSYQGKNYPLIAIYHKKLIQVIEHQIQIQNFKMMDLLNANETQIIDISPWIQDEILLNCNNQEDLEKLKKLYKDQFSDYD
ncbi:MAG: molybdenum cofactor guanylyltransferase [Flavobacteriales bacterium]|nr:molybdenum cofactor guanylyltransferase [Flavobacteriales bacterium]